MLLEAQKATIIIMSWVELHNFLRKSTTSRSQYSPPVMFDAGEEGNIEPGFWRRDQDDITSLLPFKKVPRKASMEAKIVRDTFAEYFMGEGRIDWQNNYC